jgi:NAD(P)-dependent dehydrogenase (short-subunit alcohol dehydrogenase family)
MEIKGKTVVVTGASSGIGRAVAIEFAKKGGNIVIAFRVNFEGAKETQKVVESFKVKSMLFKGDLSDEKTVEDLFQQVLKEFKSVDILINNAGEAIITPFLETDLKHWDMNIKDNLYTAVLCSKEAIKIMLQQPGQGRIINAASINGIEHMGRPDTEAYSAAKAGVMNFTKTIAKAYAPKILVNAVCPGKTKTRHYDKFTKEYLEELAQSVPIKRFITPEEIAQVYLSIAENDSICGEVIVADGGISLKRY